MRKLHFDLKTVYCLRLNIKQDYKSTLAN